MTGQLQVDQAEDQRLFLVSLFVSVLVIPSWSAAPEPTGPLPGSDVLLLLRFF